MMEVAPNDKVSDMMKRIPSGGDVYVTSRGRVLRRSDQLRSCGVVDGSAVQVVSRMRGGGRHKDKKRKAEKKQAAGQERLERKCDEEPESDRSPAIQEEEVIQQLEENDGYREIIACLAEGSDLEVERKIRNYLMTLQKW